MNLDIQDMDPQRVATAALQGYFFITERWGLTDEQRRSVLGNPSEATFAEWQLMKAAKQLDTNTLTRISYILGIYKALHTIYSDDAAADGWLRRPNDNPLFEGRPAMERLVSGDESDLRLIRQYLDGHIQIPFT